MPDSIAMRESLKPCHYCYTPMKKEVAESTAAPLKPMAKLYLLDRDFDDRVLG
jgi:hypothetical protein